MSNTRNRPRASYALSSPRFNRQRRAASATLGNEGSGDILDRIVKAAQAFAFIFTPIAVAVVAGMAQWSATDEGVRKDLVQMSLQILKEPRRLHDESVRQFALDTINQNSKVHLAVSAADQLSDGVAEMLTTNPLLKPAMEVRPQCPAIDIGTIPPSSKVAVQQLQALCGRNYNDLFWMQTLGRLIRDHVADAGASSSH